MQGKKSSAKILYSFDPTFGGEFTKKDITNPTQGICDAIIFHSIKNNRDGSREEYITDFDGNGNLLHADELFKSWFMMATQLRERLPDGARKNMVIAVVEAVKAAIKINEAD